MSFYEALGVVPITLVKADGKRFQSRGHVQEKLIMVSDLALPVAAGDVIERQLPSKTVQSFDVIHVEHYEIPEPHYQLKVRPSGAPSRAPVQVHIAGNVERSTVQVGHGNIAVTQKTQTKPYQELREEVLAVAEQAIATHKLVLETGEDIGTIAQALDQILDRLTALTGGVQLTPDAMRNLGEVIGNQVAPSLAPGARRFFQTHSTPIAQNLAASALFEGIIKAIMAFAG